MYVYPHFLKFMELFSMPRGGSAFLVSSLSGCSVHFISFHLPFLELILHRINEEEKQEIQQAKSR